MSNNELKSYFYNCLHKFINKTDFKLDYIILGEIRRYMNNNSNSDDVIEMKKNICECIYYLYNVSYIKDVLNISDDYKYGKQLKLFTIMHSNLYDNFYFFFNYFIGDFDSVKQTIHDLNLDKNGFNIIPILDEINDSGIYSLHLNKSSYNSLEQELYYLECAYRNYWNTDDYNKFVKEKIINNSIHNVQYSGDPFREYTNKKIGNIGELYWFNYLKQIDSSTTFVSRDFGDGFGYDIYAHQNDHGVKKELLIEVKSTTNSNKDKFQLSNNEYAVMKDVLSNPNANYLVATAFINLNNNYQIKIDGFMAKGECEFYSLSNGANYLLDSSSSDKVFKKTFI